jgi:hypothetical protein
MSIEKKSNDLIGNRTRDLPACSIVPQPTTLPRAPVMKSLVKIAPSDRHSNHVPLKHISKRYHFGKMIDGKSIKKKNGMKARKNHTQCQGVPAPLLFFRSMCTPIAIQSAREQHGNKFVRILYLFRNFNVAKKQN